MNTLQGVTNRKIAMKEAYIVTGTLKGNQILVLDEPLDMYDWKVRVVVEPVKALPRRSQ